MTVGRYRVGPVEEPPRRPAVDSGSRRVPTRGDARPPAGRGIAAPRQSSAAVRGYPPRAARAGDDGLDALEASLHSDSVRSSPSRRHRRQRDRHRSATAFVVVIAVFALLALVGWWGYGKARDFLNPPDYSGSGSGSVSVQIDNGASISAIGNTLVRADVVKSTGAFIDAAENDDRASTLQPGRYELRKRMSAAAALDLLLDPSSRSMGRFTAREGLAVLGTLNAINESTGIPLEELEAAVEDPESLGLPDWAGGNLEGFLFPDTYEIGGAASAEEALGTMVTQALQVMDELNFVQRAQQMGYEPYDVLIVASMVEMEGIAEDFGKVARVAYNRLEADMPLQFDSTTQYWLELTGKGREQDKLTNAELRAEENNYSTTLNRGLPPTAISNPGKAAMEVALDPPPGDWLYFAVTEENGKSSFADDLAGHERNVAVCRQKNLGC